MIGNAQEIIQWLFEQDREKVFEIKERKLKRTLTQNAYYWTLTGELARALRTTPEETHKAMILRYSTYEVVSVRSDIDVKPFFKYYRSIGTGEVNGRTFTHYAIYKGSSEMDSKEFSQLLDGLISECQEVGIPTLTPAEAAALKFMEANDGRH